MYCQARVGWDGSIARRPATVLFTAEMTAMTLRRRVCGRLTAMRRMSFASALLPSSRTWPLTPAAQRLVEQRISSSTASGDDSAQ